MYEVNFITQCNAMAVDSQVEFRCGHKFIRILRLSKYCNKVYFSNLPNSFALTWRAVNFI